MNVHNSTRTLALALGLLTAAPAVAQGTPEAFLDQAPQAQGTVSRYLLNPHGEVDGLLLANGRQVNFPPRMSEELTAAVKPGQAVSVYGFPENSHVIKAVVIVTGNTRVVEHPPSPDTPPPAPKQLRGLELEPLSAQGVVTTLLYGRHDEVNGVVLADGSIVRFPPHVGVQFANLLAAGESLVATGYGSENSYGRVLEAVTLGAPGGPQETLFELRPRP